MLKSAQAIAVVWVQNVANFANPDVARTLVFAAWWQVSVPLMTAITGFFVQAFFAFRFWMLTRRWYLLMPILAAMLLAITGAALSVVNIVLGNVKAKVMWLLVHLISVFLADLMITVGTYVTLKKSSTGFATTQSLVDRLMRMVFESALPPTILTLMDLILTQTLGTKLLWHLILNYPLSKAYIISLMYTLNCTNDYRRDQEATTRSRSKSQDIYSFKDPHTNRRGDVELSLRTPQQGIRVHTQVLTHGDGSALSPSQKSAQGVDVRELRYLPDQNSEIVSEEGLYDKAGEDKWISTAR